VLDTLLNFVSKANGRIDACVNHTRPVLAVNIDQINNSILDTKSRVTGTRCITEINKENLSSCKDLLNVVDELRHIGGIKDKKDIGNCWCHCHQADRTIERHVYLHPHS
jgi:hypothetical protein